MLKGLLILATVLGVSAMYTSALSSQGGKKSDPDLKMRDWMVSISEQLGVTCTHCHYVNDFKRKDKQAYKVSVTHIEMVNLLNQKYPGQIGEKVDCAMCHRGKPKL